MNQRERKNLPPPPPRCRCFLPSTDTVTGNDGAPAANGPMGTGLERRVNKYHEGDPVQLLGDTVTLCGHSGTVAAQGPPHLPAWDCGVLHQQICSRLNAAIPLWDAMTHFLGICSPPIIPT